MKFKNLFDVLKFTEPISKQTIFITGKVSNSFLNFLYCTHGRL